MTEYANLIASLPLHRELRRSVGREGIDETEVQILVGLVNSVADEVGPLLARIQQIFRHYTNHDLRHSRNIIDIAGRIVPPATLCQLNPLELTLFLLSAMLHDAGMVVSDGEKSATIASKEYREFRAGLLLRKGVGFRQADSPAGRARAQAVEELALAEYFRERHPQRIDRFLQQELRTPLLFRGQEFIKRLSELCESHAWPAKTTVFGAPSKCVEDSLDYDARISGVQINMQYLACMLRLSDILDFDRSRTPIAVYRHLDFTDPTSWVSLRQACAKRNFSAIATVGAAA